MLTKSTPLVYIYDVLSDQMLPPEELARDRILLPPMGVATLFWSQGYFVRVARRELQPADLLPQHCFRAPDGSYCDEYRNALPGRIEPCGLIALMLPAGVGKEIDKALRERRSSK